MLRFAHDIEVSAAIVSSKLNKDITIKILNKIFSILVFSLCFSIGHAQVNLPTKDQLMVEAMNSIAVDSDDKVGVELLNTKIMIEDHSDTPDTSCVYLIKNLVPNSIMLKDTDPFRLKEDVFYNQVSNASSLDQVNDDDCGIKGWRKKFMNENSKDDRWKVSFHFGFTRTHYHNTRMKMRTENMDVTIRDFEFKERTSADFYNPKNWKQFMDAFRWIDEPSNTFVITVEKKGHNIILSYFHPKYLIKKDQEKRVTGTLNGETIDGVYELDRDESGIGQELNILRWENTYMQLHFLVGYGYDLKIVHSEKYGTFSVTPQVYFGVMTGRNLTVVPDPESETGFSEIRQPMEYHGATVGLGAKVQYRWKWINLFVQGQIQTGGMRHSMGEDGRAKYNMTYESLTFGVGFTINTRKKRCKGNKLH